MGGRRWCRPYDRVGLAGVLNGISGPHRDYLAAGGVGFIIGDGRLKYGLEQILETYYALQVSTGIVVTFDFQEIVNPAYNPQPRPRRGRLDPRALGPLIVQTHVEGGIGTNGSGIDSSSRTTTGFRLGRLPPFLRDRHIPSIAAKNHP